MIIDTHAHLDQVDNIAQALADAYQAGVCDVVTMGVDLHSNKKNLEIRKSFEHPNIHLALGIHPGNINLDEIDETIQVIREHIVDAVAIGEVGLDYWYKGVKKDKEKKRRQKEVFKLQLLLAKEFNLPVVVHSRGAWRDCLETIKEVSIQKAVFHWYSGPLDILEEVLKCGYYVSATPSLAYSPQSREAMSYAPIEKTLIETDCPVFFRDEKGGFKAQPKDVFRTLRIYADLKNVDEQQALDVFNRNAKDFFGIK